MDGPIPTFLSMALRLKQFKLKCVAAPFDLDEDVKLYVYNEKIVSPKYKINDISAMNLGYRHLLITLVNKIQFFVCFLYK